MSEVPSGLSSLSIPRQAVVEGSFQYVGNVVLEGTIFGDVRCANLLITERGSVEGAICAETVIILGEAAGVIHANQVTLKAACSVTADIFHGKLSLENGCYFEGKSRRVADPLGLFDPDAQAAYASDGAAR